MIFDIWKSIKKKEFSPIYLLFGKEDFLINETKQLLINNAVQEEEMEFNISSIDLAETPIELAIEDAETIPFMGERKLLFLHNPSFLTAEKLKEKIDHNMKRLEAYIQQPSLHSIVVFIAPYEKLDERKKITKLLKKHAVTFEANKLSEQQLRNWIKARADYQKVIIDPAAIELMISLVGTNLFMLTSEIDKMSLFVGRGSIIDVKTVEELVSRSIEQNIFALVEKVVARKIGDALQIYFDLLKMNEEPIKILSVITGQFRLIYQVKELSRQGYGQQQIASHLKVHPYRVKLAAGQAQRFSDQELIHIMKQLADADYKMKTGTMKKELLIELILLNINGK